MVRSRNARILGRKPPLTFAKFSLPAAILSARCFAAGLASRLDLAHLSSLALSVLEGGGAPCCAA